MPPILTLRMPVTRRDAILRLAALCLGAPGVAGAQERKPARIGRLSPLSADADRSNLDAIRKGMGDLGWVDGRDYTIEARFADGHPQRLPGLALELAQRRVDVIVTGSTPGALAARKATSAIPIVMVTTSDPVADGLVATLSRPGGNVTGVTALAQQLTAKRLETIKAALPGVTRIAVLAEADSSYTRRFLADREATAQALGLQLRVYQVRAPADFDGTFAAMAADRSGAMMVLTDAMLITQRRAIVELAAKHRLPAIYGDREFVEAGGLMFYGASLADMYRHAAGYIDKILKGAKPGELPVEQPTKLELIVNAKTVKALDLKVPPSLLARVDHFVE